MLSLVEFLTENDDMYDFFPIDAYQADESGDGFETDDKDSEDKLIKKNFATGKWEGPRQNKNWYDSIVNYISPAATGNLYQSRDNPNERYVKFDDGTKFKYDLYNPNNIADTKKLIAKVYHRSNTTPLVDPIDVGIGLGSDTIFAKPIQSIGSNVLKRPMNYIERSVAGSAGLAPVGPTTKKLQ